MGKIIAFLTPSLALLALVFLLFLTKPIYSHHQRQVLGDATNASDLVFPPVTSGAGIILPDSPLFFIDKAFQQIRLLVAFDPERKAKVRSQIAAERLAELRIMLSRNNPDGINTALTQLNKEVNLSVANLKDAAASGKDVSQLAKDINDNIKIQRKILGILANQSKGTIKLQFKAARKALKEAKVEGEDELAKDEFENEIEDDLEDEIEDSVEEASESAKGIEHAINVLTQLASRAAEKNQKRREEALRHAIEVKNEALRKQEERLLELEKKKQEKILELQEKSREEARKAVKKANEAAEKFKEFRKKIKEIKTQPVDRIEGVEEEEEETEIKTEVKIENTTRSTTSGESKNQ